MFDYRAVAKYGKCLVIKMVLQFFPYELNGKSTASFGRYWELSSLVVLVLIVVARVSFAMILGIVFVKGIEALPRVLLYLLGGMLAVFVQQSQLDL